MLPLESVATATDSPRYSPAGTFRKLGTDVIGISGTPVIVALSCALAAPAQSTRARAQADVRNRFIAYLPRFGEWFVFGRVKWAGMPRRTLQQMEGPFNCRQPATSPHCRG